MTVTINGTTGITFPAGGLGNTAGAAVGTTDTQTLTNKTLTSPTIGGTPVMGASVITSGTSQASTSGTVIDFTGIPSWVKRITVLFNGVSTNGTSNYQIQIGTSSGIQNTGYTGTYGYVVTAGSSISDFGGTGFEIVKGVSAAAVLTGLVVLSFDGTNWVESANMRIAANMMLSAGSKSLGGTLDRVRITTVNGTDTFDAGSINILYE